jgi:hypothetical protein
MEICPPGRKLGGDFCWSRWRGKVRNNIHEIFRMNEVGDRRSNKRTEKYKWLCQKMTNPGGNIKTEKWNWILSHQI